MTFRVGQKVVCIKNDAWTSCTFGEITPQLDCIYTIRSICPGAFYPGETFLRFEEIRNNNFKYRERIGEAQFLSSHFRPLVEGKTSIEIFTRMLNPSRENMDA